MKRYLPIFLFLSVFCYGQGSVLNGSPVVTNPLGQPLAGATVAICNADPGTSPATLGCAANLVTIYTDITVGTPCTGTAKPLSNPGGAGSGCSNPGLTDGRGNAVAFAPQGQYWCEYYGTGITTQVVPCVFPGIPSFAAPGPIGSTTPSTAVFTTTTVKTLDGLAFSNQFTGASATLRMTAALNSLSSAGLVIVPASEVAGATPALPNGTSLLDLRNDTGNGQVNLIINPLSTAQQQGMRINCTRSPDAINLQCLYVDATAAGTGINITAGTFISNSASSASLYAINQSTGAAIQADVLPGTNGGIGLLGTTATTGGTVPNPQIAVKAVSAGNATFNGTLPLLAQSDNGIVASFNNTAAAGSANDPQVIVVKSGLNSATDLSLTNTSAGGKRWDLRNSGAVDPLTGSIGMFGIYNQTDNLFPVSITANAANNTLLVTSTGVTVGGKATATTYATATNCAGVGTAASPSVASCGSAAAGHFSCATNASGATCQVNTTAVTANSEIFVFESDTAVTGTALGVTCNTSTTVIPTSRILASSVAATSFTINLGTVTTNPACFSYKIIN